MGDGAAAIVAAQAALLGRVPLFSRLDRVALARLAARLEQMTFGPGEPLCREGDPATDGVLLLTEGEVGVYVATSGGGELQVAVRGPGDLIGEMGLITGEPRSATVRAVGQVEALRLARGHFLDLVHENPAAALAVAATLAHWLQAAERERGTSERSAAQPADGTARAATVDEARGAGTDGAGTAAGGPGAPRGERQDVTGDAALGLGGAPGRPDALPSEATAGTSAAGHGVALAWGGLASPSGGRLAEPRVGPSARGWRPTRTAVGLGAALVLTGLGWAVAPPGGLSLAGWHALVLLVAAIPLLALRALPDAVSALLLIAAWVVGGAAPVDGALSGFASTTWVLVVCLLGVGSAVTSSGVVYRLALWGVGHLRGGFSGQVVALATAGLLLGPAMPYATGRVALMGPVVAEIAEAFGYAARGRRAAGLAMAVQVGFGQMVAPFLTSSTTALLVYAALPADVRARVGWGEWLVRALPTHVVLFGGLVVALLWLYRDGGGARGGDRRGSNNLALQHALLGRTTRSEKLAVGVAGALALGFATQPLYGVDPAWLAVAAVVVLAATGVLTPGALRSLNWGFTILYGVLTGAGTVLTESGAAGWLAERLVAAVGGLTAQPVAFVATVTLLCYAVSFVLRASIAAPILTIALTPVARAGGIDPWVVGLVTIVACNGFFVPYQNSVYLALFESTGGGLFTHEQARPTAIAFGAIGLVALCASVPVWRGMGLL